MNSDAPGTESGPISAIELLDCSGEGLCALNSHGTILYLNRAAEQLLALDRQRWIGKPLGQALSAELARAIESRCRRAIEEGEAAEFRAAGPTPDSQLDIRIRPLGSGVALSVCPCSSTEKVLRQQMEKALRESDEVARRRLAELESLYASAPVGLLFVDRNLRYVRINDAMAAMNGVPASQCIGRTLREVLGDELADRIEPLYRRVIQTGQPLERMEVRGVPQAIAGADRDYLASYHPVHAADGTVLGVSAVVQDVTKQKSAETALRQSEARYRALVDATSQVVWVWRPGQPVSPDAPVRVWWEKLTGQSPAQQSEGRWMRVVHAEDRSRVAEHWNGCLASGTPIDIEFRVCARTGEHRHLLCRAVPIRNGGQVEEWVGMVQDVTERHAAEAALAQSEQRFRLMISNSPDIVMLHDRNLKYEWVSMPQYQGAVGKDEADFLDPEQAQRIRAIKQRVITSGVGERYETTMEMEGHPRYFDIAVEPRRDGSGQINGLVSYVRDITERKKTELALADSQRRMRMLFEHTQDAILLADDEGRYVDANPAACELTGLSKEQLLARTVFDITPVPDQQAGGELWRQFIRDGSQQGEYPLTRPDGSVVHVEYRAVANVVPGLHISVCRDVTERKRAEEARAFLAEAAMVLASSLDYETVLANLARLAVPRLADFCVLYELEDGGLRQVACAHVDESKEPLLRRAGQLYRSVPEHSESLLAQAVRTRRPALAAQPNPQTVRQILVNPELLELYQNLNLKSYMVVPLVARDRVLGALFLCTSNNSGRTYRQEDLALAGELGGRAAIAMENARLYHQAEIANRAKDQFLAVLSHELRTPLTPVVMTVAALEQNADLPEAVREDLAMVRRNIELETKLIDDLLDVTRIQNDKLRLQPQPTDAHALIGNVLEILRSDLAANALNLKVELKAQVAQLEADPARLQQVVWNLVKNAIKFTPQRGSILIRTANPRPDRLLLEVIDDGAGIDPVVLPRIFNAFEQGDPGISRQFGGLGLGLAISKKLVELHGGTIQGHSDGQGRGARFCVELPLVTAPPRRDPDRPFSAAGVVDNSGLRVLLVEDHADTLRMLSRLLTKRGYGVLTAGSAAGALKLLGDEPVDVIVSDIGLPDMTGHELMRQIKAIRNVPAIAVSGFGMDADLRNSHEAGFAAHITKPIDLNHLEETIRRIIERPVASDHE